MLTDNYPISCVKKKIGRGAPWIFHKWRTKVIGIHFMCVEVLSADRRLAYKKVEATIAADLMDVRVEHYISFCSCANQLSAFNIYKFSRHGKFLIHSSSIYKQCKFAIAAGAKLFWIQKKYSQKNVCSVYFMLFMCQSQASLKVSPSLYLFIFISTK